MLGSTHVASLSNVVNPCRWVRASERCRSLQTSGPPSADAPIARALKSLINGRRQRAEPLRGDQGQSSSTDMRVRDMREPDGINNVCSCVRANLILIYTVRDGGTDFPPLIASGYLRDVWPLTSRPRCARHHTKLYVTRMYLYLRFPISAHIQEKPVGTVFRAISAAAPTSC